MNENAKKMKTKNRQKKSLGKTISYLAFTLCFIIISCKSDDTPLDCGCNSETKAIITEESQAVGTITYKEQTESNSYYTNYYWITLTDPNCSNCVQHMIICNNELLSNEIRNTLNSQTSTKVKFSGELKEVCEKRFDISSISYQNIKLTKIELQ